MHVCVIEYKRAEGETIHSVYIRPNTEFPWETTGANFLNSEQAAIEKAISCSRVVTEKVFEIIDDVQTHVRLKESESKDLSRVC